MARMWSVLTAIVLAPRPGPPAACPRARPADGAQGLQEGGVNAGERGAWDRECMRAATRSLGIAYTSWDAQRPVWLRAGSRVEPYVPDWIDLFCVQPLFTGNARGSVTPLRSGPERGFSVALALSRSPVPFRWWRRYRLVVQRNFIVPEQAPAVPSAAGGRIARPAVAHDGEGAVGRGAGAGQGRIHQPAGLGHGQVGLFFRSRSISRTTKKWAGMTSVATSPK